MLDQNNFSMAKAALVSLCVMLATSVLGQDKQREAERQRLRSGEKKVATIEDAVLLHDAKDAFAIMRAPLLKPDGAIYGSRIELQQQDKADVIRGRFKLPPAVISNLELLARYAGIAHGTNRTPESQKTYQDALELVKDAKKTYFMLLKTSTKTQYLDLAPERLRLGEEVAFVGRYVGNQQYETTSSGEVRTVPIMEVMYIGALPRSWDPKAR